MVERFVQALGLQSLTVMVQDWGGPIWLGLARRRPELIRAVVIGNSFAWPATLGRIGFSLVVGSRLGRRLIIRRKALAKWLIPAGTNRALSEAELAAYLGPFPSSAPRLPLWTFVRQIRASRPGLAEIESSLVGLRNQPALILCGDADGAFGPADRDRFDRLFPYHRVIELRGAEHYIQENAPEGIADAVLNWSR